MGWETIFAALFLLECILIVLTILLIVWIPWAVLCFPGNILYDAGTSIAWFLNLNRNLSRCLNRRLNRCLRGFCED